MSFTLASARTVRLSSRQAFPPSESLGWTLTFLDRESRYWVTAQAGRKDETLFTQGTQDTWAWAQEASIIRWFTDGERRYGKALWPLASERVSNQGLAATYPFCKVWRERLEVAIKIKGSQGQRWVVWLNVDHPFTALKLGTPPLGTLGQDAPRNGHGLHDPPHLDGPIAQALSS